MRITIDLDNCSVLKLFFTIFKGLVLCRKFPDEIEKTKRGFHLIYFDVPISIRKHYAYRYFIGDDYERIKFDMNKKRAIQVLFNEKVVYQKVNGVWKRVKYCPICSTPLTNKWVYVDGNYYCINCGSKNVKVLKKVKEKRDKILFSILSKISKFTCLT